MKRLAKEAEAFREIQNDCGPEAFQKSVFIRVHPWLKGFRYVLSQSLDGRFVFVLVTPVACRSVAAGY